MILDRINGPKDLKTLNAAERKELAQEIRQAMLKRASIHGGHFGPDFGIVEATIALHTVLDSPKDKIVWDVSHQVYPHKILTGRKQAYLEEEHYDDVSGYSNPAESEHDFFEVGHTSTSISLASGLAMARDLRGGHENIIAVIGDGSMSGGEALIKTFREVKDIDHPVVVHIVTQKGKGYEFAEEDKESWHWHMPFDIETGEVKQPYVDEAAELTASYLLDRLKTDKKLAILTAATPASFGFTPERRKQAGKQFIDVGIAEEQAVAMASGLAKGGARPVFGDYATFFQRTYDQISQDVCINNNPAVFLVFGASMYSMNDVTHLCIFDIPMMANIPNLVYLAPVSLAEYKAMLAWALDQTEHPVAIRVPVLPVSSEGRVIRTDYSQLNTYEVTRQGSDVAVLGLGNFYGLAEQTAAELEKKGIHATIINPTYITGLDIDLLESLKKDHRLVVTMEDGVLDGGFGEKIARFYGSSDMKTYAFGLEKKFYDRYDYEKLAEKYNLKPELAAKKILDLIK